MSNQRWKGGRDSYRPPDEPIDPADYRVEKITEKHARDFVLLHHYSGSYPASRVRLGLFRTGKEGWHSPSHELVGVAVFSVPCHNGVLTSVFPSQSAKRLCELGRFVLHDDVPGNGETWFLGQCFRTLRHLDFTGVVSFSDPCRRTDRAGRVIFPGHIGTIYQAHNGVYLGRTKARLMRLLPDGTLLHERSISKVRNVERGWEYVVKRLVHAGADRPPLSELALEPWREWLDYWLEHLCRRCRHPGNHRYAWRLDSDVPQLVGQNYPKSLDF